MIRFPRMLKDYSDSGALQSLVPIQSAIGPGVFVTKSGSLVMVIRIAGKDSECLDPDEMDNVARRFESATRALEGPFHLRQYLLKSGRPEIPSEPHDHPVIEGARLNRIAFLASKSDAMYSLDTFFAVVYEGWSPAGGFRSGLSRWLLNSREESHTILSTNAAIRQLQVGLDTAQELLRNKVAGFAAQISDLVEPEILDSQGAFEFFRRLLNYDPIKTAGVRLKHGSFVDFQLCNSPIECHRDFLRLDDYFLRILTLKEPPARTFAHMLSGLADIPCQFIIASEWHREGAAAMRRIIQSMRRHHHNSKVSLLNYVNSGGSSAPRDVLIDNGSAALVGDLGACLEEMEAHGRAFGQFSMTLVLYGLDAAAVNRAVAQALKIFTTYDAQLLDERYNALNAWLAVLPGNSAFNLRRLWLSSSNYADLSFLFTVRNGSVRNEHLGAEYLAVLEGAGGTPYFLNLHHKDVGHTLLLGATGSGKSFTLNFLLTHLQKYAPQTYICDVGGSYESTTRLFGGSYLRMAAPEGRFTINPFCLPLTPENHRFLLSFVKVLAESGSYRLSAAEEQDLFEQIGNLYEIAPEQRRLFTLANIVSRPVRGALQKWVKGGPHAALFDNAEDTFTMAPFQTFDFEGLEATTGIKQPLLFYTLHRITARLEEADPLQLKVLIMDEAWKFFQHPVFKDYITEALKTWRKKNAAMILATQSSDDLLHSTMLSVIAESCPTKLFLSNPGMDRDAYRRAFGLNETEVERIATLVPKQQILVKQPNMSKLVSLNVDRKGYWLYTNNPRDNARRRAAFEQHGFQQGLEILSKEN